MHGIAELRSLIGVVRRRWRAAAALRTIGLAATFAALPLGAGAFAVWGIAAEGLTLVAISGIALLASVAAAVLALSRLPKRPSDVATARFIEEKSTDLGIGAFDDGLVSAVQVDGCESDPFAGLVVARAASRLRELSPQTFVTSADLRRSAAQAGVGAALLTSAVVMALPVLSHAADAAWMTLFPNSIRVVVEPGNTRVAAGRPLEIRASLKGRGANLRGAAPSLLVSADGQQRAVAMTLDRDAYQFKFESVDRSFRYKVVAGAVSSSDYSVTALFPPKVERIDVSYEYPAFSGLAPRIDEDAGDIYGPAGSRVRIRVHTDKPVADGALGLSGRAVLPLRVSGERTVDAESDAVKRRFLPRHAVGSRRPAECWRHRVLHPDHGRSSARSADPAAVGRPTVTPLEEVSIEARADDDYGLSRFELVYSVAGGRSGECRSRR